MGLSRLVWGHSAASVGEGWTIAAKQLLRSWRDPGVLVVVTHQVEIPALTGVLPSSGERVVARPSANGVQLRQLSVERVRFARWNAAQCSACSMAASSVALSGVSSLA